MVEAIKKSYNKLLNIVTSFSACSASKTMSFKGLILVPFKLIEVLQLMK